MKLPRIILRSLRFALSLLVLIIATAWTFGALWYDFPVCAWRHPMAAGFVIAVLVALIMVHPRWKVMAGIATAVVLVIAWWLTLKPSNDRDWLPDVALQPWAEVDGDVVTLHNVRNCDYRSNEDFTVHWETRTLHLSQITGIDAAMGYWGSEYMAHPILSFQFADSLPVAMSIETRKEKGEPHSSIRGLYRQYELIYIAADERDVFRVRTNYREGEGLYLYRTRVSPDAARERFLEYITTMNAMRKQPRWYNVLTTNCTTAIRTQHEVTRRMPFDWRMLLNGKIDSLFYEKDVLVTDGLPFAELKKRAFANPAGRAADKSPDFSKLIRAGRPGFGVAPP
ncbi:MAG: DUF4105 domain-containing protein [Verrucomicrobiaceae bacterium]